jgi:hypothetical protein
MRRLAYNFCGGMALSIATGCATLWESSTVQSLQPTAGKAGTEPIATQSETGTSRLVKARTEPAEPSSHVTIRLHHNTYTPEEQSRRVADVIDYVRRNGIRNVTFYVEPDADTPQDAIDRALTQLRTNGFKETQIQLNPH